MWEMSRLSWFELSMKVHFLKILDSLSFENESNFFTPFRCGEISLYGPCYGYVNIARKILEKL